MLEKPRASFPIVGIGASAGGLEALVALLDPIPRDVGMAFVVVQHLSPHRESSLPGVLSSTTRLPVAHAEKDTRIEPGHVYVVPPDRFIELSDGHLRLTQRPLDRRQFTPINHFFSSLAQFGQTRAIGVVLSGNASDGAIGLREIKAAGGIAMAQDPSTARFDSMPRAAIAAGVDFVLPPPLLAQELISIANHPVVKAPGAAPLASPDGEDAQKAQLDHIFALMRDNVGVDYSNYKSPTILRRLHRQMVLRRVPTLADYVKLLRDDPNEIVRLSQSILIHVTRFFRDSEAFEAFGSLIARQLEGRTPQDPVRIWVPGCSTGEEVYSAAIIVLEQLAGAANRTSIQVFGTDVSESAIDKARRGIYPEGIVSDVSPDRLRKYFTQIDDSYRISQSVRDSCVFARQDVTQDPPFSRLDVILCRNLLIYLDLALQQRILRVFYYALKPSGLLMLGPAESAGPQPDCFEAIDKKNRIYQKKAGWLENEPRFNGAPFFPRGHRVESGVEPRAEVRAQKDADRILLEKYTPPAVLIDEDLTIRQIRGQVGHLFAPSPGNASLAIFKMARPGLATGLRAAIERARRTRKAARRAGLRVRNNSHVEEVAVEVIPIRTPEGIQHFLVLFESATTSRAKRGKAPSRALRHESPKRIRDLEEELEGTRSELQSMIQDLEAANEELQSANEEILSSNEELQSTNEELDTAREELQSTNEEIITVNEELHGRNEDLARVNSDLLNLLASVQIAIVMVDGDLRIRRFTPQAERVLNLITADIGRPIGHIKPNVDCPTLEAMIQESLAKTAEVEREIQDFQGRWYSLKIRPYKNVDNRIDGAVLVLVDINTVKRQQQETAVIEAIVEVSREPMMVLQKDFTISQASWSFYRAFGVDPSQVLECPLFEIDGGRFDIPDLRVALDTLSVNDIILRDHSIVSRGNDGRPRRFLLNARKLRLGAGDRILLSIEHAE